MDHIDTVPRAPRARQALMLTGSRLTRMRLAAVPALLAATVVMLTGCGEDPASIAFRAGSLSNDLVSSDGVTEGDQTRSVLATDDLTDGVLTNHVVTNVVTNVVTSSVVTNAVTNSVRASDDARDDERDDALAGDDLDDDDLASDDSSDDLASDDGAEELASDESSEAGPAEIAEAAQALEGTEDGTGAGWGSPVIVVLGSSTAAGVGASSGWVERYRAYLRQNFPNFQLHNLSQGGATTYDIQPSDYAPPPNRSWPAGNRNITYALSLNPGAIIINMPTNDAQGRFSVDEQLANYNRVANLAASRGVQVWVTTPQPRNFPDASQRNNLMATRSALYGRFGDHTLDFWNGIAQGDGTIIRTYDSGDGVHLNDSGHQVLAERAQWARIPFAVLGK